MRGIHATAADLGRFDSEAKGGGGISTHPNIVPIYQVGEHDAQAFFCMKYVAGRTLAAVMADKLLHPCQAEAQYMIAIARAVQHAHEKGILHRDLKPSNILIDENDQPLVTDFGLAKRVEGGQSITGTGAIVGTPSYMAPEQAEGVRHPTTACDVYSLGAILYELLTGRPPFLAASAVETLLLVRSEEPASSRGRSIRKSMSTPRIHLPQVFERRAWSIVIEARRNWRMISKRLCKGSRYRRGRAAWSIFSAVCCGETHHAPVLENWGLLWMWHSLTILSLCALTSALYAWWDIKSHWQYMALWSITALLAWAAIFWNLRRKRGGPVTFVERQVAHAWGAGVIASIGIFFVEIQLGLDVLILTPILAIAAGMVFLVKRRHVIGLVLTSPPP